MLRPDGINVHTLLPSFYSPVTTTGNLVISGVVTPFAGATFSVTISTSSGTTRCDVYGKNMNDGTKQCLSSTGFPSIYQNAGGESASVQIDPGASSIRVQITIFNGTGLAVNLTNQTLAITVVQYKIPY
jgi:hypothetical protein